MADENNHVSLQDLQASVASKKKEAAEIKAQSESLAVENNVPVNTDPDAMESGEKFLAAIGYFSFLCILPLVLKPQSALCKFHGKQALVMLVFFLIFGRIIQILGMIAFGSSFLVHNLVVLTHVGFALYAMYYAYKGEMKSLPLFGKFAKALDF